MTEKNDKSYISERERLVTFAESILSFPQVERVWIKVDFKDGSSIDIDKYNYNKK